MNYLEEIRHHELKTVTELFPAPAYVLEIGGGSGFQAKQLVGLGYRVEAVDIASSKHQENRFFPVKEYDGFSLPFEDERFDVIFSSNVLEHIPHIHDFQTEMKRVLKKGGRAIHLMPTASWRFWTSLCHYPFLIKSAIFLFFQKWNLRPTSIPAMQGYLGDRSFLEKFRMALFPYRHGERGNIFTEAYYFSKVGWKKLFSRTGWAIKDHRPSRLFYTGYQLFGSRLSLSAREKFSRLLGSACHVFVLVKE